MIKAIIVEDDPRHSDRLLNLLKSLEKPIEVLQICASVGTALGAINEHRPELVFLDIMLEEGETGFDLLKKVDNLDFEVIFTTSHNSTENVISAIRACALDFLPKPIIPVELQTAVERFLGNKKLGIEQIKTLKANLELKNLNEGSFWISVEGQDKRVEIENVIYCKSSNEATYFFLQKELEKSKKQLTSKNIGHWERVLNIYGIVRIHNEYMVNIKHVISYIRGEGGQVEMKTGEVIPVSKSRKENLLKQLGIK